MRKYFKVVIAVALAAFVWMDFLAGRTMEGRLVTVSADQCTGGPAKFGFLHRTLERPASFVSRSNAPLGVVEPGSVVFTYGVGERTDVAGQMSSAF